MYGNVHLDVSLTIPHVWRAAEMVSGDFGLGYLILSSYVNSTTVPMVIGMLTLGFVGWFTSAIVRTAATLASGRIGAFEVSGRLTPNPALNRTGRHVPSAWRASARPAG